jgi:phospholipase/carboxylesterase
VPSERTILGGFSQGAVMAWALGAGRGRPRPAGILAMSGFIPAVEGFELDPANLDGLPVAITHGSWDPIISVGFGRDARERAEAAGADVTYLETEAPHTVDPRVLTDLVDWVAAR